MKLRKLEKLIFKHTDLLQAEDISFARSAAAAQSLIDSGKCASFTTTLRRAMLRAEMSAEDRAAALRFLEKAESRERRNAPKVVLRRKIAAASAAAVLLSYLSLVPQGRALAKSVVDWMVTFFENGVIVIQNQENVDPKLTDFTFEANAAFPPVASGTDTSGGESIVVYNYASIEEFVRATGKNPLIVDHPDLKIDSIQYTQGDEKDISVVSISYTYHGKTFWMNQNWNDTSGPIPYFTGADEYFYKEYEDKQIICSIHPKSGNLEGILVLDDSVVVMSTENIPETEALFDLLRPYQP